MAAKMRGARWCILAILPMLLGWGVKGVTFPCSSASLICRGLTCFCKLDKYRFGDFIFPSTTNLEVYMQPKLSKAMDRQEIERLIQEPSRNLHVIDCKTEMKYVFSS